MTITSTIRLGTMTLAAGCLLLVPGVCAPANAQEKVILAQSVITPPEKTPTTPSNIPDDKIDAVAGAVKSVSVVMETYDQKVARAPAAEKQRLIDEADDAMTKAVAKHGLSVEEYTAIIRVAEKDPVVRDKLLKRLD
ncbi:MAG: DUF4168 domain-containing protein [Rhodospirillales bacterium]|nr:DUF4168 domain-containing protein [Rhodospirillales bacterium]